MRFGFTSALTVVSFSALLIGSAPATASPLLGAAVKPDLVSNTELVQHSRGGSREFRRCMRAKYGPRYFRGVPRAHRFHMAQACGG